MRGWALACLSALMMGGCESATKQEAARLNEATEAATAADKACVARYAASDEYQFLKGKLPPLDAMPSMELLTNQSKPTEAESAVLLKLHKDYISPCRQQMVENATKVTPSFGAAYAVNYADADREFVKLVLPQETWGEFAQAYTQRVAKLRQSLEEIRANVNRDLAQARAAEAQRAQALASDFAQFAQQQQIIAAMNRPVRVNCMRTGVIVNCNSY
jgi:hypothetical protein